MTDWQPLPKQRSQNLEIANAVKFPKKMNAWKVQTPGQERVQTRENEKRKIPALRPTFINKLSMTSMVWNISIGQPGLDVWLCSLPAPAHLLIS